MDVMTVARSLSDCLPVNELTDAQLAELLAQAKLRHFERDEVVYHRAIPRSRTHRSTSRPRCPRERA